MLYVLGMRDLTHREARVLAVLAFHDGPAGAFPSVAALASESGMHRSRVFETLAELEAKGRLVRHAGRGRGRGWGRASSRYTIRYNVPETRDAVLPLQRPGFTVTASRVSGTRKGSKGKEEGQEAAGKRGSDGCKAGLDCPWLGRERERCPHCGAD